MIKLLTTYFSKADLDKTLQEFNTKFQELTPIQKTLTIGAAIAGLSALTYGGVKLSNNITRNKAKQKEIGRLQGRRDWA